MPAGHEQLVGGCCTHPAKTMIAPRAVRLRKCARRARSERIVRRSRSIRAHFAPLLGPFGALYARIWCVKRRCEGGLCPLNVPLGNFRPLKRRTSHPALCDTCLPTLSDVSAVLPPRPGRPDRLLELIGAAKATSVSRTLPSVPLAVRTVARASVGTSRPFLSDPTASRAAQVPAGSGP